MAVDTREAAKRAVRLLYPAADLEAAPTNRGTNTFVKIVPADLREDLKSAIVPAKESLPVSGRLIRKVSIVPMTRQLTAFVTDRACVSRNLLSGA